MANYHLWCSEIIFIYVTAFDSLTALLRILSGSSTGVINFSDIRHILKLYSRIINYIRNQSLITVLSVSFMAIASLVVLSVSFYLAYSEMKQFKAESDNLRSSFNETQKLLIKSEVERAIKYIEYNRSLSQENIKRSIKQRVDEAYEIANNIYTENKSIKSNSEIAKMVKDALRPIRFNQGRADIFIYTCDGYSVLLPRSHKFENRNSINFRDSLGNYLVRNEIEFLKQVDRGFLTYRAPINENIQDSVVYKFTYVRKFAPLNWYFGSKDYLKDFEDDLKEDLLEWLSHLRYGNAGYIFINTLDGKALLSNGDRPAKPVDLLQSGDKNWIDIFQNCRRIALDENDGFYEYKFIKLASNDFEPKVSYVKYFKEWNWIVGAGYYKNDIENDILLKQNDLKAKIFSWAIRLVVLLVLFLLLFYIFARLVSGRLLLEFSRFTANFRKASLESILIEKEMVSFKEFRELSESVNSTILERDAARIALEKEQALLRSLIDSIPDFIFFKDTNSKYVGCNKAFARYIGMKETDIIGKTDFDFFQKESAELYLKSDLKILEDHIPIRNEEWNVFSDGSRRLLDTVKVIYTDNKGQVLGIMAISRDITEKEEIQMQFKAAKEKAEESDRLKTAFLANMSHEIRTPMNSIIGFSSLLSEDSLSAEEKTEYIQHINNSGEALLNLIDDIIDISKIEAGQLNISIEPCNLKELVNELFVSFSDQLNRKLKTDVKLIAEVEQNDISELVYTDPFRLRQVYSNLLGNAIKFTVKGAIRYGYKLDGGNLLFYVKDTGIGISEADQKVIFTRFRQVIDSGIRHRGGTGLGLAISQNIIELLGGSIWVESVSGEGSIFYFTVPYKPVEPNCLSPKQKNHADFPLLFDWSSKTMLIIEDIDSHFNYIYTALSRTGINLLRAKDGVTGLNICKENGQVDLVILDVNIPKMNGYEIAREIKKLSPKMPVIAHSNRLTANEEKLCFQAGCDDYIAKPAKFNILMNILSRYLETKHQK